MMIIKAESAIFVGFDGILFIEEIRT